MNDETLKVLRQMSPINHVKPGLPPFLLMQGDSDKTVLPSFTRNFAAELKENQVPCRALFFSKARATASPTGKNLIPTWQQKLADWLHQTLVVS